MLTSMLPCDITCHVSCMFRAEYLNGNLVGSPVAMAGNQGTIITVSDLFYNVPMRLKGLGSGAEEYGHVLRVMQKYSIELAGRVGISCRKSGGTSDLQISPNLCPTAIDVVKNIYGSALAKSLTNLDVKHPELVDINLSGCLTIPTYHQKSFTFILFINGRLVDCSQIKRTVLGVYSQLLPKGTGPFVYLSLQLPPHAVDVNVHPTKSEVFFLYEQEILQFIDQSIRKAIQNSSLPLSTALAPAQPVQERITKFTASQESENVETTQTADETFPVVSQTISTPDFVSSTKKYPHQLVHSDSKARTLDAFILGSGKRVKTDLVSRILKENNPSSKPINNSVTELTSKPTHDDITLDKGKNKTEDHIGLSAPMEDPRELTSVKKLIQSLEVNRHEKLTEMIKNSVIVGLFDDDHLLIQYQSQLLMIKHSIFASQMLYQKCLLGFGFHDTWCFEESFEVKSLLSDHIALYYPENLKDVESIIELIGEKSELLLEYFSLQMMNGELRTLPRLLEGLERPPEDIVCDFLYRLATAVDWDDEEACFDEISKLLSGVFCALACSQPRHEEYVRHFLYPALKGSDLSKFGRVIGYDNSLVGDGSITELTSTHELYKIFERC